MLSMYELGASFLGARLSNAGVHSASAESAAWAVLGKVWWLFWEANIGAAFAFALMWGSVLRLRWIETLGENLFLLDEEINSFPGF